MENVELSCPQCKSNSYINPSMKIFVSPCYHSLCEMCVSRLFANGPNKCPECGISLRRSNYMSQTFEDVCIERECRIRKVISSQMGKNLEDYSDEEDYNDYLEQVEEIVIELSKLKGPKEVAARVQEIKEQLGREKRPTSNECVKRRKIEESVLAQLPEISVAVCEYLFPPEAIDYKTIPYGAVYFPAPTKLKDYKSLAEILVQRASASLKTPNL
ncbi:hypothetical protein NERG_00701 [Nematocida ausubeli]|uniref:RING-type domain-containing protein n=1 Tax=Nematocida ausubeli (strain ATCC PRA-371 / ERTm2) TaxID=1913371 RepID=H8ZAV2_NEMA1|nr:hypothetical protein NERG_00701 [Nematocida ausubeli]